MFVFVSGVYRSGVGTGEDVGVAHGDHTLPEDKLMVQYARPSSVAYGAPSTTASIASRHSYSHSLPSTVANSEQYSAGTTTWQYAVPVREINNYPQLPSRKALPPEPVRSRHHSVPGVVSRHSSSLVPASSVAVQHSVQASSTAVQHSVPASSAAVQDGVPSPSSAVIDEYYNHRPPYNAHQSSSLDKAMSTRHQPVPSNSTSRHASLPSPVRIQHEYHMPAVASHHQSRTTTTQVNSQPFSSHSNADRYEPYNSVEHVSNSTSPKTVREASPTSSVGRRQTYSSSTEYILSPLSTSTQSTVKPDPHSTIVQAIPHGTTLTQPVERTCSHSQPTVPRTIDTQYAPHARPFVQSAPQRTIQTNSSQKNNQQLLHLQYEDTNTLEEHKQPVTSSGPSHPRSTSMPGRLKYTLFFPAESLVKVFHSFEIGICLRSFQL